MWQSVIMSSGQWTVVGGPFCWLPLPDSSYVLREAESQELTAKSLLSVQRHFWIHCPRPAVDPTAHGLNFFVSLLAEPVGDRQRAHAVMAHHHDVIVGIEFLLSAHRNVSHGNVLGAFDAGCFILPSLANVEQGECFAALLQRLDLAGRDFEVHSVLNMAVILSAAKDLCTGGRSRCRGPSLRSG